MGIFWAHQDIMGQRSVQSSSCCSLVQYYIVLTCAYEQQESHKMENFHRTLLSYFCASPISSEISSIGVLIVFLEVQAVILPLLDQKTSIYDAAIHSLYKLLDLAYLTFVVVESRHHILKLLCITANTNWSLC